MKLSLDVNLSRNLRNKFNERLNFSMAKTAKFRCPDGKEIEQASFNAVCAVLDRIDSLVVHCCSLEIDSSTSGIFDGKLGSEKEEQKPEPPKPDDQTGDGQEEESNKG